MVENRRTIFLGKPTENQKLATETCPYFNDAAKRARGDLWDDQYCRGGNCPVVARFIPIIEELQVRGSCPKL